MARILEALRQADALRRSGSAPLPAAPIFAQPESPVDVSHEEMPFIEVGGHGAAVEASADVLAKPVPPKPAASGPTLAQLDMPWVAPVLSTPMSMPVSVAFRPLPLDAPFGPARDRFAVDLVAFHQPEHALNRQYAELLESLKTQLPAESPVVLCTGGASEAGRTTVLLNLAITYARQGVGRVVVVDAGHGLVARKLGLPAAPGFREVLSGAASLRTSVRESGQPNLHVLTAGESGSGLADPVAAEKIRPLLQQLRDHFDWVLIDGPTWDGDPGATGLALTADAVYLVVRQAEVKTPETADLLFRIPQRGGRLCGYIVTQP
ncbi:MAG TPA: hypothetical protein VFA18_24550 [Gemmataceae bacterium]|nr:hypothetical protein [Gemmataceae bacterium]